MASDEDAPVVEEVPSEDDGPVVEAVESEEDECAPAVEDVVEEAVEAKKEDEGPPARFVRKATNNVAGWEKLHLEPLRALSLSLGTALTAVDVSRTKLTDTDVQSFCSRLFATRSLKLSGCLNITNLSMKAVATCCHDSLTQLDVSQCGKLNAESCGWLAGTLGYGQPSCHRLASLDISRCPRMSDDALVALGQGCKNLRFLSVAQDGKVTDRGRKRAMDSHLALERGSSW